MNEKLLEKKLKREIQAMGGIALKFHSPYYTGMPDRLILLPGGKACFCELKSAGKKPNARQELCLEMLQGLSFKAQWVDNLEDLKAFLQEVAPNAV